MTIVIILLLPPLIQDDYMFIFMERTDAKLIVFDRLHHIVQSGYINSFGTFVAESVVVKYDNIRGAKDQSVEGIAHVFKRNGLLVGIGDGCINKPQVKNEQVYEYRSGRLIPGYLRGNFDFLPEPSEAIIEFKNYVYSRTSKRIYNLPGKFVKKSQYKTEKAKMEQQEKRKP